MNRLCPQITFDALIGDDDRRRILAAYQAHVDAGGRPQDAVTAAAFVIDAEAVEQLEGFHVAPRAS